MEEKKPDPYVIIADSIAKDIFNQPSRIRKVYESIKNTIRTTSRRIIGRRR